MISFKLTAAARPLERLQRTLQAITLSPCHPVTWSLLHLVALSLFLTLAACSRSPLDFGRPDLLFVEEFTAGETGLWLLEGDEQARTSLAGGHLLIEVDAPQTLQFTTLNQPRFQDFVVEVETTQLAGSLDSSYGLLFRMQDAQHFYRFDITGSGLYIVEKHSAGAGWQRLTADWLETAAIQQGLNATNRLKVSADGELLTFTINDQQVLQLHDATYLNGQIGLDAGTFARPGLAVAFDNLVVRRP